MTLQPKSDTHRRRCTYWCVPTIRVASRWDVFYLHARHIRWDSVSRIPNPEVPHSSYKTLLERAKCKLSFRLAPYYVILHWFWNWDCSMIHSKYSQTQSRSPYGLRRPIDATSNLWADVIEPRIASKSAAKLLSFWTKMTLEREATWGCMLEDDIGATVWNKRRSDTVSARIVQHCKKQLT